VGDDFDEPLLQPAKFIAQSPAQLFGRGAQRQVRLRANQIDDGFRLGEINPAIEISALGKFPGSRRTRPRPQTGFQNFGRDQRATMATDFN
jgi:hypothetical protein